jgi:hypothetical protein
MVALRLLKARKKGIQAVMLEMLYLCVYCFLGGTMFFFGMTQIDGPFSEGIWILLMLVVFWLGFAMRAFALYRMLLPKDPSS